jgi:hypothetical protein
MQMGVAVIRYGEEGDLAAALLKGHLPGAELRKDTRAGTTIDLVLGNEFTALADLADVPRLPVRPAPVVPTVARPCTD